MIKIKRTTLALLLVLTVATSCNTQKEQDKQIDCIVHKNKLSDYKDRYDKKIAESNTLLRQIRQAQDALAVSMSGSFNENLAKVNRLRSEHSTVVKEIRRIKKEIDELERLTEDC